jgi:MoxR-like ATPase
LPGLAKTLTVQTLAAVMGGDFARIQFTPDLVPSDIVGTRVYRASTEHFDVELGPIFANFVLADEINRAPAKVQSALLEVMAEGHVTIGGRTFPAPQPFLVLATQNPIESEGVYPLPEAQQDRFLMKLLIGYPSYSEELEIVRRMSSGMAEVRPILDPDDLVRLQAAAGHVYVDPAVADYAVRIVVATRTPAALEIEGVARYLAVGASPRASLGLVVAARALALLRGRAFALPEDIAALAPELLRHRLVLSYEALADGMEPDELIERVLAQVPAATTPTAGEAVRRGR